MKITISESRLYICHPPPLTHTLFHPLCNPCQPGSSITAVFLAWKIIPVQCKLLLLPMYFQFHVCSYKAFYRSQLSFWANQNLKHFAVTISLTWTLPLRQRLWLTIHIQDTQCGKVSPIYSLWLRGMRGPHQNEHGERQAKRGCLSSVSLVDSWLCHTQIQGHRQSLPIQNCRLSRGPHSRRPCCGCIKFLYVSLWVQQCFLCLALSQIISRC